MADSEAQPERGVEPAQVDGSRYDWLTQRPHGAWFGIVGVVLLVVLWLLLELIQTWRLTQPQATVLAGIGVLSAAAVSFWVGRATKAQTAEQIEDGRRALREQLARQDQQIDQTRQQIEDQRQDAQLIRDRSELADRRARFAAAAEQMGSRHAAVRIAGIHAMAGVADVWRVLVDEELERARRFNVGYGPRPTAADYANRVRYMAEAQACVDVLCAYLRLPFPSDPFEAKTEVRVREAVTRAITRRMQEAVMPSWSHHMTFDLTDATLCGVHDFDFAVFGEGLRIVLNRVTLDPTCRLSFAQASFRKDCSIYFGSVAFKGGSKTFFNTAIRDLAAVMFDQCILDEGSTVSFIVESEADLSGVKLYDNVVDSNATVNAPPWHDPNVHFRGHEIPRTDY